MSDDLSVLDYQADHTPDVQLPAVAAGQARVTPGFKLLSKYVIHAVGPVYTSDEASAPVLAATYRSAPPPPSPPRTAKGTTTACTYAIPSWGCDMNIVNVTCAGSARKSTMAPGLGCVCASAGAVCCVLCDVSCCATQPLVSATQRPLVCPGHHRSGELGSTAVA